jgi:thiamine biosynthesis lipoprotein
VVSFAVFGTTAVLLVTDPVAADQARSIADAELAAIDLACSRFRPDSEISFLNKNAGRLTPVSELFAELIAEALRAAELTGGDVDPTVGQALVAAGYDRDFGELPGVGPSAVRQTAGAVPGWRNVLLDRGGRQVRLARGAQLDLGSTAKAWAADRCAGLIASQLSCGVLVSLGGDVAVAGPPPDDGWHVKATDDHAGPGDAPGQVITIREGGLATSSTTVRTWEADGKRMHHIIDPRTGSPVASPWRTVSVAAATCLDANIASTAAIIKGEPAVAWLTELTLPARLVTQSGAVTVTPGWPPPPPAGTAT